jgi:hypothetical protein
VDERATELDLDIVGVLEGSDKSSSVTFAWDYLRHYQELFAPWRDQPINLIEIGVEHGSSLNVWRKYFSRAHIIGVDVNPDCRRLAGDRITIETGSQEDPGFLHEVCTKYPPSIVIDDGSHLAHHIVYTFKRVFPALLAGGLYLVEDVEFHFGDRADRWAGNKTVSVPDYFLGLARGRLANNTALSDVWGDDKYVRDNVDSISFIGGALAVGKRKPRDMRRALSFADRYLQSIGPSPALLLRLVEYTLRHGGPLDFAERAARQAVTIGGLSPEALRWLVEILTRQGRPDEAAALAGEALQLRPDDHTAWERLAHAERLRGRRTEAIAALERAASLNPQIGHYHSELSHLLQQGGELARALTSAQKAARLHPEHEPWQRRVMDLEQLAASV